MRVKRMLSATICLIVALLVLYVVCAARVVYAESMIPKLVDVNALAQIESGNNPNAVGKHGEHGCCQIMEETWNECVGRMDRDDVMWEKYSFDPEANKSVASYYVNARIPQMLRHFRIPDTLDARLACYNWGIGKVRRLWVRDHNLDRLPVDVKEYISRYRKALKEQGK